MVSHFVPLLRAFNELSQSDAWAAIQRGQPMAVCLGFIQFDKIKALSIISTDTRVFIKLLAHYQQWWPKRHPSSMAGTQTIQIE